MKACLCLTLILLSNDPFLVLFFGAGGGWGDGNVGKTDVKMEQR